jgi:predicted SAM-dependent methyltransferase
MNPFRRLEKTLRHARGPVLARLLRVPKILRFRLSGNPLRKLHVGCGTKRFAGWINADITAGSELIIYMERRLPFKDGGLARIYCEHVLEHTTREAGQAFLKEAHRTLEPGGVLRVAVPDLATLVDAYARDDWRERIEWARHPSYVETIRNRAQFLNAALRFWGHTYVYDREDLELAARSAGFRQVAFPGFGQSAHADLAGLETRQDSFLILEAVKD